MSKDVGRTGVRSAITNYGFVFGSAEVTRIHSDPIKGYVLMRIKTPRADLQVYATKTGKVRVFDHKNGEELARVAGTASPAHAKGAKSLGTVEEGQ